VRRAYAVPALLCFAVLWGLVWALAKDGVADALGVGLAALPVAVIVERSLRSR
jgi:hypothetical protein